MKNFINESHRLKLFQDEEKRRKQIEAYLEKVKAKKGPGVDKAINNANTLLSQGNDKAIDSLLMSIKQVSTTGQVVAQSIALRGPHSKLEEMRTLLDSMQSNFAKSKVNLDRIKSLIRYRPPRTAIDEISDDEEATSNEKFLRNLSNVKSKISHLWKEAPQGQGGQVISGRHIGFEQVDEDDSFFEREQEQPVPQPHRRVTPAKTLQKLTHKSQSALNSLNQDIQAVQSKRTLLSLRHVSSNVSFQTSEQLRYEGLKAHENLAERLLQFSMDRLNQYYMLLEAQLEQLKID